MTAAAKTRQFTAAANLACAAADADLLATITTHDDDVHVIITSPDIDVFAIWSDGRFDSATVRVGRRQGIARSAADIRAHLGI